MDNEGIVEARTEKYYDSSGLEQGSVNADETAGGCGGVGSAGGGILVWKEWWQFLLAFAAVGAICLYSHIRLRRQADTGVDDPALLKNGRIATIVQLVGMVVVVVGLLVDGKMVRFFVERYTDWAANNIFFFGSAAIGAICAYALLTQKPAND